MKNRITIYLVLCTLLVLSIGCHHRSHKNVVIILVDDLGWRDLGYSGSDFYESPHIDDLSRKSIVFTNAYSSSSVCSPTRAAILTGQHPSRINITDWIPGSDPRERMLIGPKDLHELPHSSTTLAEIFKSNNYKTFFAGKWHLGGEGSYPENHGFDYNFGGHEKGQPPGGYYSPYNNPMLEDGHEGEYLTDRLTDESIRFIDNHKTDPFFLYLSFYTVHTPIQANLTHLEKFEKKLLHLEDPIVQQRIDQSGITTLNQVNPAYASMIYALDQNVGKLIDKLKEEGLYDQTIIVLTSDNGGLSTLDTSYNRIGPTSVRPLRGGKGWLYEGGIRIPLLIKPSGENVEFFHTDVPVVSHDLFPTVISLANLKSDSLALLDGKNLTQTLLGKDEKIDRSIFWDYPHYHGSGWKPGGAVRKGDWKMIEFYEDQRLELYNLKEDVSEILDLSKDHPEKLLEMKTSFDAWKKQLNIQGPVSAPTFNR